MNYRTISQLNEDCLRWLQHLPKDIDLFVGIPRSGLLVATLLGLHANRRVATVQQLLKGQYEKLGSTKVQTGTDQNERVIKKVLVVDDSVCSGNEMRQTKEALAELAGSYELLFGAVYVAGRSVSAVDYYHEVLPIPRLFEWNLMHHALLEQACVDIDGVLCRDPLESENDDGPLYENFLATVPALRRPSRRIRWLVTCRLEKYRALTEDWLRRNGIQYDHLVMMNYQTKQERQAAGGHGLYKGRVYKSCEAELFIESCAGQADVIARESGKPVICIETGQSVLGTIPAVKAEARKRLRSLKNRLKAFLQIGREETQPRKPVVKPPGLELTASGFEKRP